MQKRLLVVRLMIAASLWIWCGSSASASKPVATEAAPLQRSQCVVEEERISTSPNGEFQLRTLRADNDDANDARAIIELVRKSGGRVLFSFQEPDARALQRLWSPDSRMVAISFKTITNSWLTKLFAVSAKGLTPVKLPALDVEHLVAKNNAARNLAFQQNKLVAEEWTGPSELVCTVSGFARERDADSEKEGQMPTSGFVSVAYRVTLRLGKSHTTEIVKSKQTLYEVNENVVEQN